MWAVDGVQRFLLSSSTQASALPEPIERVPERIEDVPDWRTSTLMRPRLSLSLRRRVFSQRSSTTPPRNHRLHRYPPRKFGVRKIICRVLPLSQRRLWHRCGDGRALEAGSRRSIRRGY